MKKPVVIGLCGYMRAGKDTVGQVLVENGYKRLGLADAVKEMALAINPYIAPDPQKPNRLAQYVAEVGWELAKENAEVRRLLQAIGTEGVRNVIGDDAWLKVAERKILQGYSYPVGHWVITDVRFPNEATWVREKLGGQVWKIVRPGTGGNGHPSETGVDGIDPDITIHNNGSLDELGLNTERALFPEHWVVV
jgi:hypothetical protein